MDTHSLQKGVKALNGILENPDETLACDLPHEVEVDCYRMKQEAAFYSLNDASVKPKNAGSMCFSLLAIVR